MFSMPFRSEIKRTFLPSGETTEEVSSLLGQSTTRSTLRVSMSMT
jgi:hypothetical protein